MNSQKYDKADLIWEATRRNEKYKKDYRGLAKGRVVARFERLQWSPHANYRWQMKGLFDPEISVDEIKQQIASGRSPGGVHPYYHLSRAEAVIQYAVPYSTFLPETVTPDFEFNVSDENREIFYIHSFAVSNRIVVSLDPTASDEVILSSIRKIKAYAVRQIKESIGEHKDEDHPIYYPRDIDSYIGWLKKYDEIVRYVRTEGVKHKVQKGVVVITEKNFSFGRVVPSDTPGSKFEGQRKAYKDAYEQAKKLIWATPNIAFSPPRTKKALD